MNGFCVAFELENHALKLHKAMQQRQQEFLPAIVTAQQLNSAATTNISNNLLDTHSIIDADGTCRSNAEDDPDKCCITSRVETVVIKALNRAILKIA